MTAQRFEVHPAAALFPLMDEEDLAALAEDICTNGLREPVWLHPDGRLLDGRNRAAACALAGVDVVTRTWDGQGGSATAFALSLNLARRHLTAGQRAVVAVAALPMFEEEAKERQRLSPGRPKGAPTSGQVSAPKAGAAADRSGRADRQAAATVGVSHGYVSDVKQVASRAPELVEEVRTGALSLPEAKALATLPAGERKAAVEQARAGVGLKEEVRKTVRKAKTEATRKKRVSKLNAISRGNKALPSADGPWSVIYADPPWKYEHVRTESRAIENQYPTMELEAICAMDVAKLATPDAVLFLWATVPKLEEALKVVAAWGFSYRTGMVWVKSRAGMGNYARLRHELLLIAVRGAPPTPREADRPDSVIEAPTGKHSAKPAEAAEAIERMYPELRKVELFCRSPRKGWDAWGNQA